MKHPYPYVSNNAEGYVKEIKMCSNSVNQYRYNVKWDKFLYSTATIWYSEWEIVPCSECEDYDDFQEKINDRMS